MRGLRRYRPSSSVCSCVREAASQSCADCADSVRAHLMLLMLLVVAFAFAAVLAAAADDDHPLLQHDHVLADLADSELPEWIHRYAESPSPKQPLALDSALVLYDRLLQSTLTVSEISALLNLLLEVEYDLFVNVVSGFGAATQKSAEILAALMDLNLGEASVGVPEVVLDAVRDFVVLNPSLQSVISPELIRQVRRLYPAPFDSVFPHNAQVARHLLRIWNDEAVARHLLDPQVVLALLRYGIRFDHSFLTCFRSYRSSFEQIYPFLGPVPRDFTDLEQIGLYGNSPLFQHVLRSPHFRRRLQDNKADLVAALFRMMRLYHSKELFAEVAKQPFFAEIVRTPSSQRELTLMQYAAVYRRPHILEILGKARFVYGNNKALSVLYLLATLLCRLIKRAPLVAFLGLMGSIYLGKCSIGMVLALVFLIPGKIWFDQAMVIDEKAPWLRV